MLIASLTDAQVMQLPDFCFGERYVCATYYHVDTGGYHADMSPIVLPEKCVLWEINIYPGRVRTGAPYCKLSLGSALPANEAAFNLEQSLVEDLGNDAIPIRGIFLSIDVPPLKMNMKQLIPSAGKQLLTMLNTPSAEIVNVSVAVVFSNIPTRVPDWMVSI